MQLAKLSDPFPLEDIEWRVSRAGIGANGIYCRVLAYITARAVQNRLDDVCEPENWRLEQPQTFEVYGRVAFPVGISIRIHDLEWVTKWDVAAPPAPSGKEERDDPAKNGFSRGLRRAGAQWGIGRYLYYLKEARAEVTDAPGELSRGWNYATLKTDEGKRVYYWKEPSLPGWALPKEPEAECLKEEVVELVAAIRAKLCPDVKNPKERQDAISRFVYGITGEFPIADYKYWTRDAYDKVLTRIQATTDANGPSADVPFGEES